MIKTRSSRVPLAVAALTVCAALGAGAFAAAPAGASATFDPQLSAVESTQTTTVVAKAPASLQKTATKRVVKPKAKKAKKSSGKASGSELSQARALLAAQIRRHPILKGTTVTFGNAHGYQAIAFYTSGRIVISPNHRASLSRIINHEVWHVIDWRDNHRIDWGERVPR